MKVLITGNSGFIGSHLTNYLKFVEKNFEVLDFNKNTFNDKYELDKRVSNTDLIIHLAGINRSNDEKYLYDTNVLLTRKLIDSIKRVKFKKKIAFISSNQENLDTAYGKSKLYCRTILLNQSKELKFDFYGFLVPNVFGPFCRPNYNSFISTFCFNLINNEPIKIIDDKTISLIHIINLIKFILFKITKKPNGKINVNHDLTIKVSEVKEILQQFHDDYFMNGIMPEISTEFKLNLFNTYRSYLDLEKFFPKKHKINVDERGIFSEILRSKNHGQYSYSITKKNIERGNHFHTKKIERFSIIKGEAIIQLRKIDSAKIFSFELSDKTPSFIDIPTWYTHKLINSGTEDLISLFWINEFYDENNSDTYSLIV